MSEGPLPLLLFSTPTPVKRWTAPPRDLPRVHVPHHERQVERLNAKFQAFEAAFDTRRLELQAATPNSDPDLIVVLETVGPVDDAIKAAEKIAGLEWLAAMATSTVDPDDDFYFANNNEKPLNGKLFLLGSNRRALTELIGLWRRFELDQRANLGRGFNDWKKLFAHLKEVRFWGPKDRLQDELRNAWLFRLESDGAPMRFEIEAWCFGSGVKNAEADAEIRALVAALHGQVLDRQLIDEISYHGFLVEMPSVGIRTLLSAAPPALLLSERVMFFRPQGQAVVDASDTLPSTPDIEVPEALVSGAPTVAMLDGLPVANHPRLRGRLLIEDPLDWSATYPVSQRRHGTAMASLIVWGELDGHHAALRRPVYVQPILRSDPAIGASERMPDDRLLIDVVHAAVRRMFETVEGVAPTAPSVKAINLSVGDKHRPFAGELSAWARLLDWLSHKHRVLFIVSVGNQSDDLVLSLPRETLAALPADLKAAAALRSLVAADVHRRLLAPAEAINALTVGASFGDASTYPPVGDRHTLFQDDGVAPYSCIGPGFRRAMKPDILIAGGRVLYREKPNSPPHETQVGGVWTTPSPPGQRVASPPDQSGDTAYTRGTSNAAALATRAAARACEVIDTLRASGADIPTAYDAVLTKALLAHGANVSPLDQQLLTARPELDSWEKRRFVSRYVGYGVADIDRALTCTAQRVTMLGVGALGHDKAVEFRVPIPEALSARIEKRRLTVTLAWLRTYP